MPGSMYSRPSDGPCQLNIPSRGQWRCLCHRAANHQVNRQVVGTKPGTHAPQAPSASHHCKNALHLSACFREVVAALAVRELRSEETGREMIGDRIESRLAPAEHPASPSVGASPCHPGGLPLPGALPLSPQLPPAQHHPSPSPCNAFGLNLLAPFCICRCRSA